MEHEGVDRPGLGLSGLQSNFSLQVLAAAAKVNANVVVILINAGAVSIDALIAPSAAIVEALYPVFGAPQVCRAVFCVWGTAVCSYIQHDLRYIQEGDPYLLRFLQ